LGPQQTGRLLNWRFFFPRASSLPVFRSLVRLLCRRARCRPDKSGLRFERHPAHVFGGFALCCPKRRCVSAVCFLSKCVLLSQESSQTPSAKNPPPPIARLRLFAHLVLKNALLPLVPGVGSLRFWPKEPNPTFLTQMASHR
jgi:hypothetical protein